MCPVDKVPLASACVLADIFRQDLLGWPHMTMAIFLYDCHACVHKTYLTRCVWLREPCGEDDVRGGSQSSRVDS